MKKIGIINQRYGLDINGGSELYTRQIAERLTAFYDVEVLTSCSKDYTTWENFYPEGEELINGVKVRRFKSLHPRNPAVFGPAESKLMNESNVSNTIFNTWIENLGPCCYGFVDYLKQNSDEYDLFIVVTYLYFLQVKSIPIVGDKAIFIPTAHDEPYIHFAQFQDVFTKPKAYIFLTSEEKKFVFEKFRIVDKKNDVLGVGVDLPQNIDEVNFRSKYDIKDEYIIYVGRVDSGKNCPEMFRYFIEYKKRNNSNLKLVVLGKAVIDIPMNKDIINLGFVSDEDKFAAIKGSKVLLLPSKYESLSISVLEAMALKKPVLVNGVCEVLKGHCLKSNGGLFYVNFFEFEGCLNYMLKNSSVYEVFSKNALKYIEKYYSWDVIMEHFRKMIESLV